MHGYVYKRAPIPVELDVGVSMVGECVARVTTGSSARGWARGPLKGYGRKWGGGEETKGAGRVLRPANLAGHLMEKGMRGGHPSGPAEELQRSRLAAQSDTFKQRHTNFHFIYFILFCVVIVIIILLLLWS